MELQSIDTKQVGIAPRHRVWEGEKAIRLMTWILGNWNLLYAHANR